MELRTKKYSLRPPAKWNKKGGLITVEKWALWSIFWIHCRKMWNYFIPEYPLFTGISIYCVLMQIHPVSFHFKIIRIKKITLKHIIWLSYILQCIQVTAMKIVFWTSKIKRKPAFFTFRYIPTFFAIDACDLRIQT